MRKQFYEVLREFNNRSHYFRFLEKALTFKYNNYYFSKILYNTVYNSEETVIVNYFEAMILVAFKFDAAITAIYREKANEIKKNNLIQVLTEQYTTEYAKRSMGILNLNKGK